MKPIRSVCVVIRRNGLYSALRNTKRNQIEFSGGKLDPGETLREAAAREALEELSVHVTKLIPLYTVPQHVGGKDYLCTLYEAFIPDHEDIKGGREGEAFWATRDQVISGGFGGMNLCAIMMMENGVVAGEGEEVNDGV